MYYKFYKRRDKVAKDSIETVYYKLKILYEKLFINYNIGYNLIYLGINIHK